jgi:hypothetical protein
LSRSPQRREKNVLVISTLNPENSRLQKFIVKSSIERGVISVERMRKKRKEECSNRIYNSYDLQLYKLY